MSLLSSWDDDVRVRLDHDLKTCPCFFYYRSKIEQCRDSCRSCRFRCLYCCERYEKFVDTTSGNTRDSG